MLFVVCLLILGTSLTEVSGQFDLVIPKTNGELYERVCEEIKRIRDDYKFYIQMYKNLLQDVFEKYPTSNFCREQLNEMFAIIKCIIDLAEDMDNMKDGLLQSTSGAALARTSFRGQLERWLLLIQEKQQDLFRLANEIRNKESSVNPVIIQRFDELNVVCIDMVQEGVLNLLQGEVEFAAAQLNTDFQLEWAAPIPQICGKVKSLIELCRRMMAEFRRLRTQIKKRGFVGPKYPNEEMNQLCNCIIEYCQSINELLFICRNAQTMTPAELEKRLCEWLMEIKEIRNKLISYWDALFKWAKKAGNSKLFRQFKRSDFLKIFLELDKCIFKIECYYINIVLGKTPLVRG